VGFTRNITITNTTHRFSFYAKASGLNWVSLEISGFTGAPVSGSCFYDLVNGVVGTNAISGTITPVGNGWYRCSGIVTPDAGDLFGNFAIYVADGNLDITVDRDGTSSILIWGAQLETGSTATAYQRVTDQYNVTEAGVSSVSYLFFDGVNDSLATPSIDFPAYEQLGSELVANGDFASATGWTAETGWSIGSGVATKVVSGANANLFQDIGIVAGRTYRVTYTLTYVAGGFQMIIGGTASSVKLASGTYTDYIVAGSSNLRVSAFGNAAFAGTIDNISVKEVLRPADKMTVFAGVRKLVDTGFQVIGEISTIPDNTDGSFGLGASTLVSDASRRTWSFGSRGTVFTLTGAAFYAAPITNVLTGIGDVAGDNNTIRVNGAQIAQVTSDQGTGTYRNSPLYIGARNSASNFLSGHLYSLIVRGAQSNTGQISSTETWVASRTGIVI
jgi:hypothetical protein